ncbi:MAG: hypothetical protein M0Z76_02475 [Gammaproteobacteria bacterium]|nr:hypothetical protein [Gammaproteobacteria bacterium]
MCAAGADVRAGPAVDPAAPLYERVPTRDDATGERLADFMMLFPGLRERPGGQRGARTRLIKGVLLRFPEVVFADLNLRLNLLWVSVRTRPGVILDIACCLKLYLPEALLVAPKYA